MTNMLLPIVGGSLYLLNESANRASSRRGVAEISDSLRGAARAVEKTGENISESINAHAGAVSRASERLARGLTEAAKEHQSWRTLLSLPLEEGFRAAAYYGVAIEYMRAAWVTPSEKLRDVVADYPEQAVIYFTSFDKEHRDDSWEFILSHGTFDDCFTYCRVHASPPSANPKLLAEIGARGRIEDIVTYCRQRDGSRMTESAFAIAHRIARLERNCQWSWAILWDYLEAAAVPFPGDEALRAAASSRHPESALIELRRALEQWGLADTLST